MASEQETSFRSVKFFSHHSDDPRIEVSCASRTSPTGREPYSFRASTIDHLKGAGDGKSRIVLKSGVTFTLSLPYAALVEKIDAGQSPVDLSTYVDTEIGDMVDGMIWAGISPDTQRPMYTTSEDESSLLNFAEAQSRAAALSSKTGEAYRVPSASELNVLFNNRAAIGGFKLQSAWYRSATLADSARVQDQHFVDGRATTARHDQKISVRLVHS